MGAARRRGTYAERLASPLGPQLNHKVDKPLGRYIHHTENKHERARREHYEGLARLKALDEQLRMAGRLPVAPLE
jgi:hypothetical protein